MSILEFERNTYRGEYYEYKYKLLDLFLKSFGDGFSHVIEFLTKEYEKSYTATKRVKYISANNLKQKLRSMRNGNYKAYHDVYYSIYVLCADAFSDGPLETETERFCEKKGSDKYFNSFGQLCSDYFSVSDSGNFLYESIEDALSYMIAKFLYKSEERKTTFPDGASSSYWSRQLKEGFIDKSEYKWWIARDKRVFRKEYYTAFSDVRFNKKKNKTFFKWCIDEFKKSIALDDVYNSIIDIVFKGKNDISSTSFEKLKYETGKRNWGMFEHLFENEMLDKKLMAILDKDDKYHAAYNVFQSRMMAAFFLNNFCEELPNFVGKKNPSRLEKIIVGDVNREKPEDFLVLDHDAKTKKMLSTFLEFLSKPFYASYSELESALNCFDKKCLATESFKAYFRLTTRIFNAKLSKTEREENIKQFFDGIRFFEEKSLVWEQLWRNVL